MSMDEKKVEWVEASSDSAVEGQRTMIERLEHVLARARRGELTMLVLYTQSVPDGTCAVPCEVHVSTATDGTPERGISTTGAIEDLHEIHDVFVEQYMRMQERLAEQIEPATRRKH